MKKNTQIVGGGLLSGLALYAVAVMPLMAFAQLVGGEGVGGLAESIIAFINQTLVPLVFALALIVFIWGLFQSFILGGADPEAREKGKGLMLWGIVAFFVMVSVWGLVNILTGTLTLNDGVNLPEVQER